jgi:hypothetical protein
MVTSTRRNVIPIIVAAAALALILPTAARACSCIPPDIERDLPAADAAVVGTIEARTDPLTDVRATVLVRVERVAKGDVTEDVLEVWSPGSSASCGLRDMPAGQRVGLLLERRGDDGWASGLCRLVDPDELAQVEPSPDTSRRPGLLARLMAALRALCAGSAPG